jgi:hypothetical protein
MAHAYNILTALYENLVKENSIVPDSIVRALNAQHHQLNVLERGQFLGHSIHRQ